MSHNTKYIFLILEERSGEYGYQHRSVHQLFNSKATTAKKFVKDYLKEFYGGKAEKRDGGYDFFGGGIFVKLGFWSFVSKEVFNILNQYL